MDDRLVSAKEVIELIDRDRAYMSDVGRVHAIAAVRSAETIDAKPVVHGHWIAPQYPQMMATCSVCGSVGWVHSHKYCSQCGATMDGGIEYGN